LNGAVDEWSDPGLDPVPFSDDYLGEMMTLEREAAERAQDPPEDLEGEPSWVTALSGLQDQDWDEEEE
jgi:hypothetical protein